METRKQANYALKTESVKNRTVCSNLYSNHTYANPKILKIRKIWIIYLLIFWKKKQLECTLLSKTRIIFMSAKVSVFQQDQINYHPTWSQRLYLALYWNKIHKHDYHSSLIMWTHKNNKGKCCVFSQQALFFNAF